MKTFNIIRLILSFMYNTIVFLIDDDFEVRTITRAF